MLSMIPLVALATEFLPNLIEHLGGKRAGELSEQIATVVREVAGIADPAAAARVIHADPAKAAALKVKLAELHTQYTGLAEKDRQADHGALLQQLKAELASQVATPGGTLATLTKQAGGAHHYVAPLISVVVLGGFFVFTLWILQNGLPQVSETTSTLLNVTVGSLVAGFTAVVNYWLGSSQGSRDKDKAAAVLQATHMQSTTAMLQHLRDTTAQHNATLQAFAASPKPASAREPLAATRAAPLPVATPQAQAAADAPQDDSSDFDRCIQVVLVEEGGFVDNPADPGGATNMGITLRTLSAWRHQQVTVEDVRTLTVAEAKQIYRAHYWNLMRCDQLPRGVDLMVMDFGVNAGPATSIRLLQRCVGVTADGAIGPITLRAARAAPARQLIEQLAQGRIEFYRGLSTFAVFGQGWLRRVGTVQARALALLG